MASSLPNHPGNEHDCTFVELFVHNGENRIVELQFIELLSKFGIVDTALFPIDAYCQDRHGYKLVESVLNKDVPQAMNEPSEYAFEEPQNFIEFALKGICIYI